MAIDEGFQTHIVQQHYEVHPRVQQLAVMQWWMQVPGARVGVVGDPAQHPIAVYCGFVVLGKAFVWRVTDTHLELWQAGVQVETWPLPVWVHHLSARLARYPVGTVVTGHQLFEEVRQ